MKKVLTAYILLAGSLCTLKAQDIGKKFTINGYIKGIETPNGYAYLRGNIGDSAKHITDSSKITDGHFSFKGKAEPTQVTVFTQRLGHPHFINPASLFIDGGTISITAEYDTTQFSWLKNVKIKGSASQDEFEKYNEKSKKLTEGIDFKKLQEDYKTATEKKDTAALAIVTKIYQGISEKRRKNISDYIKENPKSFVSLNFIKDMAMNPDEKTLKMIQGLFLELDPSLQFSANGKRIADRMAFRAKGMLMGKHAGDFSQPTVDGKMVKLSDYKGKYVLLDFWASWCGPCREENPNVLAAYNRYKDKGFDVLAVSLDKDVDKWVKAIKEDKMPWTQVSDLKVSKNDAVVQFGVLGIPDNFLIDPNGIVIARALRGEELNKKLEEVFKGK